MILLSFFLLLLSFPPPFICQVCEDAPDEGRRVICHQITTWDKNARTVPIPPPAMVRPPGVAGAPMPSVPATAYDCMDIACICGFFGGTGGNNCVLPNGQTLGKSYRKEYRVMSDDERNRYTDAMWAVKRNGDYGVLSRIHAQFSVSAGAHSGPAFLPWHREFVKRLEIAVRKVDPTVSLPYWDSVMDSNIPDSKDSVLWSDELMGYPQPDYTIQTGAFKNWLIDDGTRVFRRRLGEQATLYVEDDITNAMAMTEIDQVLAFTAPKTGCPLPAMWDVIEYTHGNPHVYVGGDMLVTTNSTNDPIFFQHHAFVDLIWEQWRQQRQTRAARETEYPPDNINCSSAAHFGGNTMTPFYPKMNRDGLSNQYMDNLVSYAPRPTCTTANTDGCGSKYLFCDLSHGPARCASKIKAGGTCSGYTNNEDLCYLGTCTGDVCVPTSPTPTVQPPTEPTTVAAVATTSTSTTTTTASTTTSTSTSTSTTTPSTTTTTPSTTTTTPTTTTTSATTPTTTPTTTTSTNTTPKTTMTYPPTTTTAATTTPRTTMTYPPTTRSTTTTTPRTTMTYPITTTSSSTITTTSTTAGVDETCFNDNICCASWSRFGQCRVNPGYMTFYCKASCNVCTPTTYDLYQDCSDRSANCVDRVNYEGCSSDWVRENCRESCSLCWQTRDEQCSRPNAVSFSSSSTTTTTSTTTSAPVPSTPTTRTPDVPSCWNNHVCCLAWSVLGYCSLPEYASYMTMFCAPSCNRCPANMPPPQNWDGPGRDFTPSCSSWAARGECYNNAVYMRENCKVSCGQCSLLDLNNRLSACGFGQHRDILLKQSRPRKMPRTRPLPMISGAPSTNSAHRENRHPLPLSDPSSSVFVSFRSQRRRPLLEEYVTPPPTAQQY